jgi:hypothetical protein
MTEILPFAIVVSYSNGEDLDVTVPRSGILRHERAQGLGIVRGQPEIGILYQVVAHIAMKLDVAAAGTRNGGVNYGMETADELVPCSGVA